jgi:hypothetical protein
MTQQTKTKLQLIVEELKKELNFEDATLHLYVNLYGTRKKKDSNAQPEELDELSEFGSHRLQLTGAITTDAVNFTVEAPSITAEPGKLSGKHMKFVDIADKFGFRVMKVLNTTDEV